MAICCKRQPGDELSLQQEYNSKRGERFKLYLKKPSTDKCSTVVDGWDCDESPGKEHLTSAGELTLEQGWSRERFKLWRNNFWCHSCTKTPFVVHSDSSVHDVVIFLPNKWLQGRANTAWPDTDVRRQKHFAEIFGRQKHFDKHNLGRHRCQFAFKKF